MDNSQNQLVPELYVSNFQNSIKFYTQFLGFSIQYQREEEGFAYLSLGHAQIMIDEIGEGRTWHTGKFEHPFGRGINFQIEVEDVEALYKKLKDNHIPIFLELEEKWYRKNDKEVGNKQFLVQDPDGYLLRFVQDLGEREK
jgi:catechol 2,3-dioxygenase-like lactoylglutathione lyase family enzyme